MKSNKAVLTLAEKCKNVLAANWQGSFNTVKADAKGSKGEVYTSKVKYILKRGKPYIWVPEQELHNVNTILDERGSFSVASPFSGPLGSLLKSIKKFPTRVALSGDVVPLKTDKVQLISESLKEIILSEKRVTTECSYAVSGVLSSSNFLTTSRSENIKKLLDESEKHVIYRFNISSCMFIDGFGCSHEIDLEDMETSKADVLAPLSARIIDGVNQSQARRRALMLFCYVYSKANARDALMLSIDRKGFDVLAMVPSPVPEPNCSGSKWKEFRFTFKEEANDIECFCRQLVEMEEEAIKMVSSYSGLA